MVQIPKVNEENVVIGETTIAEAKQNGWPRRVARVFVFNEHGELLLQKRSTLVRTYPGLWDSCGGHVDLHESYEAAGARELREELGVDAAVESVDNAVRFKDIFIVPCRAVIPYTQNFTLKEDEVSEIQWMPIEDFERSIQEQPAHYTPWCVHTWETFRDKLMQ